MTKEEIYRRLALTYKYTPNQIADMNPFQQLALLNISTEESNVLTFNNMSDYLSWKGERKI